MRGAIGYGYERRRESATPAAGSASLVFTALLALSGFHPLNLVNISIVFGMVLMPLTYYPIMGVAMDKGILKRRAILL